MNTVKTSMCSFTMLLIGGIGLPHHLAGTDVVFVNAAWFAGAVLVGLGFA